MAFRPQINETMTIGSQILTFCEDPRAPGQIRRKTGRKAVVLQLRDEQGREFALKVFSLAYRSPQAALQAESIGRWASLPGLSACRRIVIQPTIHPELVILHPELRYAVLMPWIEGQTWEECVREQQALSTAQSRYAAALVEVLWGMERQRIAHCNLDTSNVLVCVEEGDAASVHLVGLENLYAPGLELPEGLRAAMDGAADDRRIEWSASGDRYTGAMLLGDMLRLREAPSTPNAAALPESQHATLLRLYARAAQSASLVESPTFLEWSEALRAADLPLVANGVSRMGRPAVSMPVPVEEDFGVDAASQTLTVAEDLSEYAGNASHSEETNSRVGRKVLVGLLGFILFLGFLFVIFRTPPSDAIVVDNSGIITAKTEQAAALATQMDHRTATAVSLVKMRANLQTEESEQQITPESEILDNQEISDPVETSIATATKAPRKVLKTASGAASLDCQDRFLGVQLADHYVTTKPEYAYHLFFTNEEGWPEGRYQISVKRNASKSSGACYAEDKNLSCGPASYVLDGKSVLQCKPYPFYPSKFLADGRRLNSTWCAFDITLTHPACGTIFVYEYINEFK